MRVKVTGAPGYADFEGEAVMLVPAGDWSFKYYVVEYEFEGRTDFSVFPDYYVKPVETE